MLAAFLVAVGVSCALTAVLAVLMVVADATIGNYGDCTLTVNDDAARALKVTGGRSLLNTLKEASIFIPSACGGRGSCGLCKLRILEGAGDPLPTETPWLTPEELKNHVRLSCQVKVKSDMRIVVPEDLFGVRQYRTVVAAMADLTHDIKEVRLKLVEPTETDFKAGQYFQFEVPEYELTDEPVYRAYSASNDPVDRQTVEMEIRLVPNGICTTYVHQRLRVGEPITINGPYGDFFLRPGERDIVMIAGGSGMAPVKAILLEMARTGNPRKTRYYFGAKSKRDLFLIDAMRALETSMPDFRFIPALSEPAAHDAWDGETGLITDVVDRLTDNAAEAEAYLCGSPFMIDACIEVLSRKGMPAERIFYDKFS